MQRLDEKTGSEAVCKVLVVDDHPIVRKGLSQTFEEEPGMTVCGEAAGIQEAMKLVESQKPDLIVLDIALKDGNGLELMKRVRSQFPGIKILVSSMHEDWLFAERALHAGALGYINKEEAPDKIIEAARTVLKGKVYLNEAVTERMLSRAVKPQDAGAQSPMELLTDRELEIFELLGHGRSTRQIASTLHISVKTVETHRENIKHKLNLTGTNELIQRAVEWTMMQRLNLDRRPDQALQPDSVVETGEAGQA